MNERFAECDLDAIVAIRDQIPTPRGVADVVTATGTVRATVAPDVVDLSVLGRSAYTAHPFSHYE